MANQSGFNSRLAGLRSAFISALGDIDGCASSPLRRGGLPTHNLAVLCGVAGETLLHSLEAKGIYVSNGAACSSKKGKSRFQEALGLSKNISDGAVRISFSIYNTTEEAETAAREIKNCLPGLMRYTRR
jgi:cysteine desulfurase